MGMGIGAGMTGLRPIIEGMNMGFLLLAFNQISNNCGMLHYTSGGQYKTPVVIRGPGGVGRQLGAEHSQRLESYFQSIPGVQLVACSTVQNSKALLKSVSDGRRTWAWGGRGRGRCLKLILCATLLHFITSGHTWVWTGGRVCRGHNWSQRMTGNSDG